MAKVSAAFMALALPATIASADQANPLGQVLALMDELAAKVTAEGEEEQAGFEKYAEWCETVATDSHHAIKTATAQKEKLEAKIEDLNANIEEGTAKIEDLAAAISKNEKDLEDATGIRDKERSDFAVAEKELIETVDTLGRAIKIIQKEMNKGSFAQVVASNDLTKVIQALTTVVDAAALSSSDQHRLTALVQAQQDAADDESLSGAPAAAAYESKSGGIVDTLEDLKEKADGELSDLRKTETKAQHDYDMLKQGLSDQLDADKKDMAEEKDAKSSAEEGKATAEGDLRVTSDALAKATEELETASKNCMRVAADHGKTVAARAEELKVIAEAKQIVVESTSGGAASFLQVATASHSRTDLAHSDALALVKKLAKKQHSAALAQLASQITAVARYGGDDPFAKVKGLITDMISKLEQEAADAADEKKYCDAEMKKTKAKKGELDSAVEKLTGKINQDSARSVELKEEVKELEGELAALAKEQAEMDKMRQSNHASNMKSIKELNLGLSGVRKALGVLREYYEGGGSSASLLQDADSAPPAPKTHSKSGGAGGSIINLLEVCESDFAKNLAEEQDEEETRAEAYEQNTQENKVAKASKEKDVKYKSAEAVKLDKTVAELSSDLDTQNTELSAVNEYWAKVKDRCVAKPESYEDRKRRREEEIAGLKEALSVLENEAAFVQRRKHHRGHHMRGMLSARK